MQPTSDGLNPLNAERVSVAQHTLLDGRVGAEQPAQMPIQVNPLSMNSFVLPSALQLQRPLQANPYAANVSELLSALAAAPGPLGHAYGRPQAHLQALPSHERMEPAARTSGKGASGDGKGAGSKRRGQRKGPARFAECLERVDDLPDNCAAIKVSHVSKLGQHAMAMTQRYFEDHFGEVVDIFEVFPEGDLPSDVVFVVMSTREAADRALSHGAVHHITPNHSLKLQRFVRRLPEDLPISL